MRAEQKDGSLCYRCQFCNRETPVSKWNQNGDECPKCGRLYDWIMAQDSEE